MDRDWYWLLCHFKDGFFLKAVFPPRNLGLMRMSRWRFKQSKNCLHIPWIYVLRCFVHFWLIFGDIWKVKIKCDFKIRIWSLKLVDR